VVKILTQKEMEKINLLVAFIKFLSDNSVFRFNIEDFRSRFKLQKYVFIARFFGLDLGYSFSLYIHGPYSPDLAGDYYRLNCDIKEARLPEFRKEEFLRFIKGRDDKWLEIASTLLLIGEEVKNPEELIEMTLEVKPSFDERKVRGVLEELKAFNLP